jgi:hypothetical protein
LCIARDGEILGSCKGDKKRTQVPCGLPCRFSIDVVDLARAIELEECHSEPKYGANENPSLVSVVRSAWKGSKRREAATMTGVSLLLISRLKIPVKTFKLFA